MKLFLYLYTFFAFSVNAQESKPKFHQQLYLEPNIGVGRFNTVDNDYYEMKDHYWVLSGSLGLNYRNSIFKTGIDFNYFVFTLPSFRIQTSVNFHKLLADNPKEHLFFGPSIGYGYSKYRNYEGFPYLTFGLESYCYNFHFAIKYDYIVPKGYFNYLKTANYIHLEVGYAIHLGKKKNKTQE